MHVHICIHIDHDIKVKQIIALVGFTVILNDDICNTYEHFYTIAGQTSNRTTFSECLLLQTNFFEANTYNVV